MWKLVYDYVSPMQIGEIVTYKDLSEAIDQDIRTNRSLLYTANRHLLRDQKKLLVVERGVGYKLVDGLDIMYHAEDRQVKAKREVSLAHFESNNINTIKLTPGEKQKLQDFMSFNANIRAAFIQKIDRLEKANQVTQLVAGVTQEDLAALREWVNEKKKS